MSTPALKRSIGLYGAIATAVGLVVASSTLVTLGQGMGLGGPGFIYAMIFALILNLFVAFSFAELSAILPRAGGINHFTLPALGPFMGMVAVISGYVIVNMFAGSAEASVAGIVFQDVFVPGFSPMLFSFLLVAILGIVNILGVDLFVKVQMVLTTVMIGSMMILGIIGLTGIGGGTPLPTSPSFNPMGIGVLSLTALAFWLFVGIELVTPMAEEIKKPRLYIPIAMIAALLIILVSDLLYGFASLKYVPMDVLAGSAAPHVDTAKAMLGRTGQIWIGIVSLAATATTVNTLLAAIPRMLYGMALEGQLPQVFGQLTRWKTPGVAIGFMLAALLIFVLSGIATIDTIIVFIMAGALSWFITYIIAHLDVLILRRKYPNAVRNFKSPFGFWPQVLGIAGMLYMMFNIFPDPVIKAQIYKIVVIFVGASVLFSALWVKLKMKKGLFETTTLETLLQETGDMDILTGAGAAVPANVATKTETI
ncbi:MAG: APC family permease [Desulfitobacteriaceae bacterium]